MVGLPQQFLEDRALRDAARAVFVADITHARSSLSAKGVATRVGSRIGDGAKDVFEVARLQAEDNRGILAILIGALVLWFAREPIREIFGLAQPEEDIDASPEVAESDPEPAVLHDIAEHEIGAGENDE